MDRELIIRLAREVWDTPHWNETQTKRLVRFADLVAAHEREACAKVCDKYTDGNHWNMAGLCAEAIRSRT